MAFPDSTTRPANEVVLNGDPKGVFLEGILDGTPRPGVIMQLKAGGTVVGGRNEYEVYNQSADGVRGMIAILLPNFLQGGALATQDQTDLSDVGGDDAQFEDEDHIYMYCPVMGEEVNVRVAIAGTGTGDAIAIGDKFMVDDGTGLLIAVTGSEQAAPFQATEAVADVKSTGTMVRCIYTGY